MASNIKVERLISQVKDLIDQRLKVSLGAAYLGTTLSYDSNHDPYLTVNGAKLYVKFEAVVQLGNNQVNPITGLVETVFVPHLVRIGVDSGTQATGTITLLTAVAGNTVTINGVTFTAAAAENQATNTFKVGVSDSADAASLAKIINGSTSVGIDNVVYATVAANVVTVHADVGGTIGNLITLAKVGVPITISGATLTGGTDSTLPIGPLADAVVLPVVMTCAVEGTEVRVYEKGGIAESDLTNETYFVASFNNTQWGFLNQQ